LPGPVTGIIVADDRDRPARYRRAGHSGRGWRWGRRRGLVRGAGR